MLQSLSLWLRGVHGIAPLSCVVSGILSPTSVLWNSNFNEVKVELRQSPEPKANKPSSPTGVSSKTQTNEVRALLCKCRAQGQNSNLMAAK